MKILKTLQKNSIEMKKKELKRVEKIILAVKNLAVRNYLQKSQSRLMKN
jgi:hypothetical protein